MTEWKTCTLGDILTFQRGRDLPKTKMTGFGFAVAGSNGIIGYHSEYTTKGPAITIGRSGNVGNPHFYSEAIWAHNTTLYVKEFKNTIPEYVYYFLKTLDLANYAGGSAVPTLNRNHLHTLPIVIPDMITQKKIADILICIDQKIKTNDAINRNLYDQIDLLCRAWLTDYEPFGGKCPSDWEVTSLGDIAQFISGYSYKGKELVDESNVAMATIKNFERTGGFKLEGYKMIAPSDKLKPSQHVNLFDTLVAHTDLTQNAAVIGNAELVLSKSGYTDIVFSMDLVKVLPRNENISQFLLAALLHSNNFKQHCLGYVNGTTVLHLSKKALPDYKLLLPKDLRVLKPLSDLLEILYRQVAANIDGNIRLEQLRDTLIPRLMSGELDVSDLDI